MAKRRSGNASSTSLSSRARRAENVVGIDPHKRTLTATVLDGRGGVLGTASFRVSGDGHRSLEGWATRLGPVQRWGIEGASGLGRHTAIFLIERDHDVRDVCPTRTARQSRKRRQGKTDALDSLHIARETQADPDVPHAFKRAGGEVGPDETIELLSVWHRARISLLKTRQRLLHEADALLGALPETIRDQLPATSDVRARLRAVAGVRRGSDLDAPSMLRLQLLDAHANTVRDLDAQDRLASRELGRLTATAGSTLSELCGIADRSDAELLVEVGDPRRFPSEGSFARFNGTAPLPASSAEGDGEPVRHRLNRGGNRRVNAVLHRMAVTQLRCDERARAIYDNARRRGHTKKEAMRVLKRHLSDVVYRRMIHDANTRPAESHERDRQTA